MAALTDSQKREIEERLRTLEADMLARVQKQDIPDAPLGTADGGREVGDLVDVADHQNEIRSDAALLAHYRKQLVDIQGARERVQQDDFGICIDCGIEIPFERLQVYPMAERCAPCQQRYETQYAQRPAGGDTV